MASRVAVTAMGVCGGDLSVLCSPSSEMNRTKCKVDVAGADKMHEHKTLNSTWAAGLTFEAGIVQQLGAQVRAFFLPYRHLFQ